MEYKSVRVSGETYKWLIRTVAELQIKEKRRITVNEAISYILGNSKLNNLSPH